MFLAQIRVKNFRNFQSLDLALGPSVVIVGENNVGKSNLLHALRLVLDPDLPDAQRQLEEDDFWDGLPTPIANKNEIEVALEFQDYAKEESLKAIFHTYRVPGSSVDTARVTYRFRPKPGLKRSPVSAQDDYEFIIFGGIDENQRFRHETRSLVPMEFLGALRDAATDLASWRRSPLRPLIERIQLSEKILDEAAKSMDAATGKLTSEQPIKSLTDAIEARLQQMVGSLISIDPTLGFVPAEGLRLLRSLRIFGDGAHRRPVADLSLGVNNLLYLLLLFIDLEDREKKADRAKTILAIEEPEAHVHPHLQRLIFHDALRREAPVLLTTHSPHVASVSPLRSIVLLRKAPASSATEGRSIAGAVGVFDDQEIADLERYLDATRGEILFARGVVLVEGAGELFVVPAFAKLLGAPLDQYGISVCSVHGTDFLPYVKLLGPSALGIPFVVVTDGDPGMATEAIPLGGGVRRVTRIAVEGKDADAAVLSDLVKQKNWDELKARPHPVGCFVGEHTLEVDLVASGYAAEFRDSLKELGAGTAVNSRMDAFAGQLEPLREDQVEQFLKDVEATGKGRVAQRLASKLVADRCPQYLSGAIKRIVEQVS